MSFSFLFLHSRERRLTPHPALPFKCTVVWFQPIHRAVWLPHSENTSKKGLPGALLDRRRSGPAPRLGSACVELPRGEDALESDALAR